MENERKIGKHLARSWKLEESRLKIIAGSYNIENSTVQYIKQLGLATQTINPVIDELANMAC